MIIESHIQRSEYIFQFIGSLTAQNEEKLKKYCKQQLELRINILLINFHAFIYYMLIQIFIRQSKMKKVLFVLLFLIVTTWQEGISTTFKLTVVSDPSGQIDAKSAIQIYPAAFSSPVDNLKNKIFTLFRSQPIDGCSQIGEPKIDKSSSAYKNPYLVVVDGSAGFCGYKRRIQMAKEVGAKGLIIMQQNLEQAIDPYGDFSDSSFLVFIAKQSDSRKVILPNTYAVVSLSVGASKENNTLAQLQLWMSTLDHKSYELIAIWDQTLKQIPAIRQKIKWKPRYALWGCNSGLFTPASSCVSNPQYLSTCACAGQFCSPETNYKAADAIVKQDIRQKIIYQNHTDQYFKYIEGFTRNCLKQFQKNYYAEDCAINLMMNLGIDYYALQQQVDNFLSKCNGDTYQSLLLDRNRFSQLGAYPAVILDRQPIVYSSKRDFQNQICKKLGLDKEQGCAKASRLNIIINVTVNILFFILIVAGLVAIVGGLFFIYRKAIRKQMQKQMKMQVSASVQHYFALTESK